jgi:hypothetical protein
MSTIERVRASRSRGLALAAVIAGVGHDLEYIFRPEEAIPEALARLLSELNHTGTEAGLR